jgi:DNA-binding GntR family transcriptional regulator
MSLSDRAYDIIKREIITCVLAPGEQIVQAQLAERYGIGTTPVREALQRLAQEGFVRSVPRFGYVVTPVTLSDLQEIYELRAILEAAAVCLAAVQATDGQLEQIRQQADFTYVYRDVPSYTAFLEHNAHFHRSVASLAGNQRLVDHISRLLDELMRVFHLGLDLRDSAEEMRSEHVALAEALIARDARRAEELMRRQIGRSQQRVVEALLRGVGDGARLGLAGGIQLYGEADVATPVAD